MGGPRHQFGFRLSRGAAHGQVPLSVTGTSVGEEFEAMPGRDEAEQPPVVVDDRQGVLARAEHGGGDHRHVVVGSHPWPRSEAEQLVDREVMSPQWPGWPLQRDIALIEHSDRTDALVDHDQMLIVLAVELTPRAEQGGLRIDGPRVPGHHLSCCGQPPAAVAGLRPGGFLPFPCRQEWFTTSVVIVLPFPMTGSFPVDVARVPISGCLRCVVTSPVRSMPQGHLDPRAGRDRHVRRTRRRRLPLCPPTQAGSAAAASRVRRRRPSPGPAGSRRRSRPPR